MGDGDHSDKCALISKNQGIGETLEIQKKCSVQASNADTRLLGYQADDSPQFMGECAAGRYSAIIAIPAGRFFRFSERIWIESNVHQSTSIVDNGIKPSKNVFFRNPDRLARVHVRHTTGNFFVPSFGYRFG